jgi:(2R)-3-sulfolactate dehydrogenase (NADP+)
MKKNAAELLRLARNALENAGANPAMADSAAKHLIRAEEHGLPSHGLSRVPIYCGFLRHGRADGAARPVMLSERGAVCLIDNRDGLPYESAQWAIGEAMQRARRNGIGFSGVTNSGHVGVLGIHLLPVGQAGMVGVAFTNSPAAIPPWGGKTPLFGTDPVAFVFPRGNDDPLVIDLALTIVARGKIMLAMQKGEKIPEGWALDRDGKPTTDSKEALDHGSLFAIGGAKGAMLAMMVELLCCGLTGAALAFENDSYFEPGNAPRIGHTIIAIDPGATAGSNVYFERVESLVEAMLADPGVRLPGDRRHLARAAAARDGVDIPDPLYRQLQQLAAAA